MHTELALSKEYLISRIRANPDGNEQNRQLEILWSETPHKKQVVINCDSITRVTFCDDYSVALKGSESYFDNFNVVHAEISPEAMPTECGESRLIQ